MLRLLRGCQWHALGNGHELLGPCCPLGNQSESLEGNVVVVRQSWPGHSSLYRDPMHTAQSVTSPTGHRLRHTSKTSKRPSDWIYDALRQQPPVHFSAPFQHCPNTHINNRAIMHAVPTWAGSIAFYH